MRWGILADIHANLEALEAVLTALDSEQIDRYLCLGDIVGYGADPGACITEVKRLQPVTIAGNHDWASVGLFDIAYFNPYAQAAVLWTRDRLSGEDKNFLQGLELVYQEKELTLVHGSPVNPEQFEYIFNTSSALKAFRLLRTRICFIGHSHAPVIFMQGDGRLTYTFQPEIKLNPSQSYIVNAGSVGQPRDGNPCACYVVYDTQEQRIQIKRVAYDIPRAQAKIIQAGLPRILAERLASGQ